MQKFATDLKFVLRQLRKSLGFAITAVLMLAFGIGATTAIFSIVEGVLLRPLPFPESDRLVVLSDHIAGVDLGGGGDEAGVTVPDIKAYTRDTHSFAALGGYQGAGFELSGSGDPAQVNASRVTAGIFSALGVAPQLGRVFTADEDEHHLRQLADAADDHQDRNHRGDGNVAHEFGERIGKSKDAEALCPQRVGQLQVDALDVQVQDIA